MGYKWCAVPECKNTTIKTPNKLFVTVPRNAEKRKKWLELARRNVNDVKPETAIFFCEDHFNMETDMTNYYQYKMGFSKLIIMGDEVLPSKFYCQQDRRKRTGTSELEPTRSAFKKRQRLSLVQDCEQLLCIATPSTSATPDRIPKESYDNPEAIEATVGTNCYPGDNREDNSQLSPRGTGLEGTTGSNRFICISVPIFIKMVALVKGT